MTPILRCELCHQTDSNVRWGLIQWATPNHGERFSGMPKCIDQKACRSRVEATGGTWPLAEKEPRPRRVPA